MDKLKIFISYAIEQKRFAGDLKSWFEDLVGIETFVAHNDIDGGTIFPEEILSEIRTTDLFICILSDEYRKSKFCDQELGIAIALHKKVLPIKFNMSPYGFIEHIQAFVPRFHGKFQIERLFHDIMATLLKAPVKTDLKTKLLNTLVLRLSKSPTYDLSYKLISFLLNTANEINENQRNVYLDAYENNRNVSRAYNADTLKNLLTIGS